MKKRLLALFCTLTLLFCVVPAAAALENEAQQAAKTLVSLHLLDSMPTLSDLKAPVSRVRSTELLVRAYGVTAETRDSSPQDYAIDHGWITVFGQQEEPVPTSEFCASLLRQLGYDEFPEEEAVPFARRIALTTRDYGETLTLGDLCEIVRDALICPDTEGVTYAQRLVDTGVCTEEEIEDLFPEELTAREAADRYMPAVFRLDTFYTDRSYERGTNDNGGSGFFVSSDGLAVTNYHAIDNAVHATATLVTGETFEVERVLFYDVDADLALLKISQTTTDGKTNAPLFTYLELADDSNLRPGDEVYTIGVPLGLVMTISDGVVSAINHEVAGFSLPCVINTADISHGSSGGVLMNVYGHVVGVTTGAYTAGNNLYISVPLTPIQETDWEAEGITLAEVVEEVAAASK